MTGEEAEAEGEGVGPIAAEVMVAEPTVRTPTSKLSGMTSVARNLLLVRGIRMRRLRLHLHHRLHISISKTSSNLSSNQAVHRRCQRILHFHHLQSRLFLRHNSISMLNNRIITHNSMVHRVRLLINMAVPSTYNRKCLCRHLGRTSILHF
jgi:hypothetical protein